MLSLSQGHLTLLDTCPRKYQHVVFDALSGPATYEQQTTTQWGSQFHLLMQQRSLDLPVEIFSTADVEMTVSLTALAEAVPEIFEQLATPRGAVERDSAAAISQSEHRRTLAFDGYLLTVVYDWLVLSPGAGQIYDWKTHQQPPRRAWLQDDWQTRLYLYVLCETAALPPETIEMTYWFVRSAPRFYRFGYGAEQHERTRQDLMRLTAQLTQMRDRGDFSKVPVEKGACDRCPFGVRCDRLPASAALPSDPQRLLRAASQLRVDEVEEIPL